MITPKSSSFRPIGYLFAAVPGLTSWAGAYSVFLGGFSLTTGFTDSLGSALLESADTTHLSGPELLHSAGVQASVTLWEIRKRQQN